ncbi:Adaptive-response sensory-kinase SasA [Pseudoalteromonas holothuriae]|uniref:histidine kinase n=1 Tax=Pseudoalteromonas holothuriae TaxID=2963714 RepID=A0A9W4R309_9GAMM|nr:MULTISPECIES: tetratricopeptide repeat protein [unclassified Pseudoalteromonas]CAH9052306.1 Adaptive-response sensory-kinase SasA [Pseudoalteromonas sp. CIP111951]CAH9064027.1 Adaptive-response sensory-kinase SasA [Pseudoalteromonas sp. CIP111854]
MLIRLLLIFLFVSFYAMPSAPTPQQVKAASGKQQLLLLNQYMKAQSNVNAREALALAQSLTPNLPLQQYPQQRLLLQLWQGVALTMLGKQRDALILLDTVINESKSAGFSDISVEALYHRADVYVELWNYELALSDGFEALSMLEKKGDLKKIADAQTAIANMYDYQDKIPQAYEWFLKAKNNYIAVNDIKGEVSSLGSIGLMYRFVGDFDNALSYQLRAIEGHRKIGDQRKLAISYNNTAIIYKDLGKYQEAINMHTKSLELKRKLGYERGMVFSFNNLGETYRLAGDLEAAKAYLTKAESLANKLKNRKLLSSTNLYLGRIAITEQRYDDARRILDAAMQTYQKSNETARIAEGFLEHGNLSNLTGQPELAITQLLKAIEYAKKAQKNVVLLKAYDLLSQTYADLGNYKTAYKMQRTYQSSRDTLFDLSSQQRIEMLIVKNNINETRRNLKFIKQESMLTEAELHNKITNRNFMILAALSTLILLGFFYNRRALQLANKSREAIQEKEQKLSLALWASSDVLWSWDIEKQKVSRENASQLGVNPCDDINPNWENLNIHSDDLKRLTACLDAILEKKEQSFEVSYRVKTKNGEWTWVQDKGKVVEIGSNNEPLKVAGIQHDITILKQQEADLVVLNTELEQRVKQRTHDLEAALDNLKATQQSLVEAEKMAALGSLVAGLAHEINTPLGTVIMAVTHLNAQLKQLEVMTDKGTLSKQELIKCLSISIQSADLIFTGIKRTSALVEQFKRVAVSAKGEGQVTYRFEEIVNTAFHTAFNALGKPQNVTLVAVTQSEITTYIDPLLQVIEQLLSNAIEHAEPNDMLNLYVTMRDIGEFYEVIVEDDGVGINDSERSKIFEPFYTLARHKGHAGLGLNITFNLVSQVLDGKIHCERSEFGGAKFIFSVKKEQSHNGVPNL